MALFIFLDKCEFVLKNLIDDYLIFINLLKKNIY